MLRPTRCLTQKCDEDLEELSHSVLFAGVLEAVSVEMWHNRGGHLPLLTRNSLLRCVGVEPEVLYKTLIIRATAMANYIRMVICWNLSRLSMLARASYSAYFAPSSLSGAITFATSLNAHVWHSSIDTHTHNLVHLQGLVATRAVGRFGSAQVHPT